MRKKVGQAFAIIVAITIIDSVVGYYFIQDMDEITITLDKQARESIHIQQIIVAFLQKSILLDEYIQTSDSSQLVELGQLENNITRNIALAKTLAAELGDDQNLQAIEVLDGLVDKSNMATKSLIALVEDGNVAEAHDLLVFELEPRAEKIEKLLNGAVTSTESQLLEQLELAKEVSTQSTMIFIVISFVSVIITVMLWSAITKDV